MKNTLRSLLLASAGIMTIQSVAAASYTVYSSVQDIGGTYVNFDLAKFNSNLGTLTGVVVEVVQSDLVGSASVTNNALEQTTVGAFNSIFTVKGVTSGLGYTQTNGLFSDVVTTPDWTSTTINPAETKIFTVDGGQSVEIASRNVASGNFSTYSSVGGTGVVQFAAKNAPAITTTGGSYTVNGDAFKATTKLAITYTYTAAPVPEPSSALLSAVALSGMVLVRRRGK